MKRVIIPLLLLSLLATSSCKYFKKSRLFSKEAEPVTDMTVKDEPKPLVEDTTDIFSSEMVEPPTTFEEPSYAEQNGRYFMIVGSFQNYNLAKIYAEKIQEMGYQSQIIEASNGFYRVSAKAYDNFNQGISEIDDFRASVTPRAWLHVKH